jgi:hypothetical protein
LPGFEEQTQSKKKKDWISDGMVENGNHAVHNSHKPLVQTDYLCSDGEAVGV